MSDLFEQATKAHLRFKAPVGMVTAEDLWGFSLTDLNGMAKVLHHELQETEVSFIDAPTAASGAIQLKFDVVKRVIDVKLAERDAKAQQKEVMAQRKFLQEVLHDKKNEALRNLSVEEIEKQLKAL
jgi:hypothetical protein